MIDWAKRRDIPLAILGWTAVVGIFFWLVSHASHTIAIVVIAAFLAYVLSPAVRFLAKYIPKAAAIVIVYLVVISSLGLLIYLCVTTAVVQLTQLAQSLNTFFTTPGEFDHSVVMVTVQRLGISEAQVLQVGDQLVVRAEQLTASIVPFISSLFTVILDVLMITILSIYFLIDGSRFIHWIRNNAPLNYKRWTIFFIKTIERIAGGYIRSQTTLAIIIGVLVGGGMALFQVPYAVLLGVLSFILEYIPILGSLIAGVICVLLALTKGWLLALVVLGYFVFMHVLEGDILGPRIVGKALGLHPLISLVALIAGTELFGITGALLACPVAGIIQSVLVSFLSDWKET